MATFENMALKKLLTGDSSLIPDLSMGFFSGRSQKVFKLLIEYYAEHSKLPSPEILKATITAKAPANVQGVYSAMVDAIMDADVTIDNDALIKSLHENFVLRNVDGEIQALIDAQREKDPGKVKAILSGLLEDLSIQNVQIGDFVDEIEKEDNFSVCPSGLGEDFDEMLGGGYSGLTVLTAKSGGGKSILLSQSAIASHEVGKNVLMMSLELSGKVLGDRVRSYLTGISATDITTGNTTVKEKATIAKAMKERFEGKKNVWRVTTSPVDTDELINIIKVEHQIHNIDVVVIDYLALISPSKYDRSESWLAMANIAKRLHILTKELGIVIVTASQVNEVKKAKDGMEPEITTRGSRELEFSATQMHFIDKMQGEDPDLTPMTFFQIKNRIAKKVHSLVMAEFHNMKVVDTGARLT